MVVRQALLAASRSSTIKNLATAAPPTRAVVARFVAGEHTEDAVRAASDLAGMGLHCTIDYLGEDVTSVDEANATMQAYRRLLAALAEADLTDRAEVSLKLSAMGQALPSDSAQISLENARLICQAAQTVGTTVTLDMEDHQTTDLTLETLRELRKDFPTTGGVLQAALKRTEQDCRDLSYAGSRIRLCKGAYSEPPSVAYQSPQDVDLSYVRCLKILMAGQGYPMIATHDPRLIDIAGAVAVRTGRARATYEFQMLFGVRSEEQRRLAAMGEKVRVYVPFGDQWYPYLIRRMAEKPANLGLALRAMTSRS
ncbi:MAG: proline dehydrogenase family protein [Candidatus Nanopelagicales bacterium]